MLLRWIIRSFFIALLLLCVGGWVGSYKYDCSISYGITGKLISAW